MTRLRTDWITPILTGMDRYNRQLAEKLGCDLTGLVQDALQLQDAEIAQARAQCSVAVVPVTQGEGIIGAFGDAVAAIVTSMGFRTEVMPWTDVEGLYRAMSAGHRILFLADDTRYVALHTARGVCADNNEATARGFIQVLRRMMERRGRVWTGEPVLQIGYGIVGREAAAILTAQGVPFAVYDADPAAMDAFRRDYAGSSACRAATAAQIPDYRNLLDLTNTGGWLRDADLADDALYASPGVPCSLAEETAARLGDRAVWDQLEIGTAMMLGRCIRP